MRMDEQEAPISPRKSQWSEGQDSLRTGRRRDSTSRDRCKTSRDASQNDGTSLYVSNIAPSVNTAQLQELFDEVGKVSECTIVYSPVTRESRGFAFVRYEKSEDAKEAIARLDGQTLDGRRIVVAGSKRRQAYQPTPGQYKGSAGYDSRRDDGYNRGGYYRDHSRDRRGYRRSSPDRRTYGDGYQKNDSYNYSRSNRYDVDDSRGYGREDTSRSPGRYDRANRYQRPYDERRPPSSTDRYASYRDDGWDHSRRTSEVRRRHSPTRPSEPEPFYGRERRRSRSLPRR